MVANATTSNLGLSHTNSRPTDRLDTCSMPEKGNASIFVGADNSN